MQCTIRWSCGDSKMRISDMDAYGWRACFFQLCSGKQKAHVFHYGRRWRQLLSLSCLASFLLSFILFYCPGNLFTGTGLEKQINVNHGEAHGQSWVCGVPRFWHCIAWYELCQAGWSWSWFILSRHKPPPLVETVV